MRDNTVYVGSKPILNYCMAVMKTIGEHDQVVLRARGSAISRAVDVAEVTRSRYLESLVVDSIEISTEELESREGGSRNVSAIAIVLHKA